MPDALAVAGKATAFPALGPGRKELLFEARPHSVLGADVLLEQLFMAC